MKPEEWNEVFSPQDKRSARQIRAHVGREARGYLASLAPGITITTNQLVEALYPRAVSDRSLAGDAARTQIYKYISQLAQEGMEDCCMKGEVQGQYMGKPRRPWLWFCPIDPEKCPACGQTIPERGDEDGHE